jgi:hypothetical protein
MHPPRPPFFVFSDHVLSEEDNRCRPAHGVVLFRVRLCRSQTQHCAPIRRPHYHESSVPNRTVKNQIESQLVYIEANAPVHIPDMDRDEEDAQIRKLRIQTRNRFRPLRCCGVAHRRELYDEPVNNSYGQGMSEQFGSSSFRQLVLTSWTCGHSKLPHGGPFMLQSNERSVCKALYFYSAQSACSPTPAEGGVYQTAHAVTPGELAEPSGSRYDSPFHLWTSLLLRGPFLSLPLSTFRLKSGSQSPTSHETCRSTRRKTINFPEFWHDKSLR